MNIDYRRPTTDRRPSSNFGNGHNSAMGHPIHLMFGSSGV